MILALAALLAQDWPRWRGPEGSATSDASPLPLKWTSTDRVLWSTVIPGEGSSSPVVRGDLVFLTAAQNRGSRPRSGPRASSPARPGGMAL